MAKASRNANRKRKIRRNISLLTRQVKQQQSQLMTTHATVLFLLAQKGGEVTVTKGTMEQVLGNIATIGWETKPGANENEVVVKMVVKEEPVDQGDISVDESDITLEMGPVSETIGETIGYVAPVDPEVAAPVE